MELHENPFIQGGIAYLQTNHSISEIISHSITEKGKKDAPTCTVGAFAIRGQSRAHENLRKAIVS